MRYLAVLSLLGVVLVACGPRSQPVPSTLSPKPTEGSPTSLLATPIPTEPEQEKSPVPPPGTPTPTRSEQERSPLPKPGTSPLATPSGSPDRALEAAKEHLAAELDITPGQVEALTVEPVDWSDASLGCPEPGKVYAQVITPGYRVLLKAEEEKYELHTDESGRSVVICEPAQ